ncbi:large subunit ribosomal protein LP2 [Nematocida sp. AWRm80]|nr:large subunit ribosomal protein LP2 [Nematocida sp. AWRm80]
MDCLLAQRILEKSLGKQPSASEIESLLKAIGATVDTTKIHALVKKLEGKDTQQLIQEGLSKVQSSVAPAASATSAVKEEAKKEESEEEEEGSDDFELF